VPDSPGFWDSLSNGYSYVKGKVSEGATWTENRVSQTADSIQKQLDQTDPVGSAEFGILRGAGGVLYGAAKGTVGTVVDLGEAGVAGAKWVYNNPQQAWQNTTDAAAYVDDLMSDPNKMLALAQQGGGLVYTKLAGLTKQQWEEFKGDIAAANTPGEMGQVAGKWAAKLGLTVYAVRSAIQGLKAICEGGAAAAAEEGGAAKSLKGAAGDEGAADTGAGKSGAAAEERPSWRQSEKDVGEQLGPEYREQVSFKDGEEVDYGTKGSTRPDWYKPGESVEVKNYNVETGAGQNRLVNNVVDQAVERANQLPPGTVQSVVLDVRGQSVTMDALNDIVGRMTSESGGILKSENIVIRR